MGPRIFYTFVTSLSHGSTTRILQNYFGYVYRARLHNLVDVLRAAFSEVSQWQYQAKLMSISDGSRVRFLDAFNSMKHCLAMPVGSKCGRELRNSNGSILQMEKRQSKHKKLVYLEADWKTNC